MYAMRVELICRKGLTETATESTANENTETNFRIARQTRQAPTEEHRGTGGGEQEQQLFEKGQGTKKTYVSSNRSSLTEDACMLHN